MTDRRASQRPIRIERKGVISQPRCPYDEPLSPGLRKEKQFTQAIGFTAQFSDQEDSD